MIVEEQIRCQFEVVHVPGALQAARRAERKLGKGNYGPWSDFEWGMINGKLSALRWALGDEWDMLDT
jgi:hypothetical protein